jgi:hypothetical protein
VTEIQEKGFSTDFLYMDTHFHALMSEWWQPVTLIDGEGDGLILCE